MLKDVQSYFNYHDLVAGLLLNCEWSTRRDVTCYNVVAAAESGILWVCVIIRMIFKDEMNSHFVTCKRFNANLHIFCLRKCEVTEAISRPGWDRSNKLREKCSFCLNVVWMIPQRKHYSLFYISLTDLAKRHLLSYIICWRFFWNCFRKFSAYSCWSHIPKALLNSLVDDVSFVDGVAG